MTNAFRHFLQVVLLISGTAICTSTAAQQDRFVFIQSENSQPFYVRIGETVYNSSAVGHLTIHGLSDGTYRFAIGFPHQGGREQLFTVNVNRKDGGYYLKNNPSGGWVLYNWLTEEILQSPRTDSLLFGERKKDDGFASLMAAVVNDSAVLYTSVVKQDPPPPSKNNKAIKDTTAGVNPAAVVITDSAWTKTDEVITGRQMEADSAIARVQSKTKDTITSLVEGSGSDVVVNKEPADTVQAIAKLGEQTSREEKRLVFLDHTAGIKTDTIVAVIPLEQHAADTVLTDVAVTTTPAVDSMQGKRKEIQILESTIVVRPGEPAGDSSRAMDAAVVKTEKAGRESLAGSDSAMAVVSENTGRDAMQGTDSAVAIQSKKTPTDSSQTTNPAIAKAPEKPGKESLPATVPVTEGAEGIAHQEEPKASKPAGKEEPKAAMPVSISGDTPADTDSAMAADKKTDSGSWSWQSQSRSGGLVMVNSDCVKFATEHDLDKLRVKMLAQKDYGNRIFTAHKAFRNMCFSVKQVKALSELFPDDELRFRFYETAWPFVSDSSNFKTLEETLTDPFFITRFRTLLKR